MRGDAPLPLKAGDVVANRYRVERLLGVGGMGAVVAAHDTASGERVAIKVLLPQHRPHAEVVARFQRESRATARLRNEHIVRVMDSGLLPDGLPFMVMEHLEGRDLKSQVKNAGPLSVGEAATCVAQACSALSEAHALGIIHRDLKPANLFLTRRANGTPLVKVLDFGIAKFESENVAGDRLDMTRTNAVLGSRSFMAPEQMLQPKDVDPRADIWALGVILFFLLTGRTPFHADTPEALVVAIVQGTPDRLREIRPDVPSSLEAVVARCLAKNREERFASATELGRALAPFGSLPALDPPTLRISRMPSPRAFEGAPETQPEVLERPKSQERPTFGQRDASLRWPVAVAGAVAFGVGAAILVTELAAFPSTDTAMTSSLGTTTAVLPVGLPSARSPQPGKKDAERSPTPNEIRSAATVERLPESSVRFERR